MLRCDDERCDLAMGTEASAPVLTRVRALCALLGMQAQAVAVRGCVACSRLAPRLPPPRPAAPCRVTLVRAAASTTAEGAGEEGTGATVKAKRVYKKRGAAEASATGPDVSGDPAGAELVTLGAPEGSGRKARGKAKAAAEEGGAEEGVAAPAAAAAKKTRAKAKAAAGAPEEPWSPPRLRGPAKPRTEEAAAAAAAERAASEARRALRRAADGAQQQAAPAVGAQQPRWYALKCTPEKERYCAQRLRNLLTLLPLTHPPRVYLPRRHTLGDAVARAAMPPAAHEGGDEGLWENSGDCLTEGLVMLRCLMSDSLAGFLVEERSVLGFMGALAEGTTLERGREAERVALQPIPMPAAMLARYITMVQQPTPAEEDAPPGKPLTAAQRLAAKPVAGLGAVATAATSGRGALGTPSGALEEPRSDADRWRVMAAAAAQQQQREAEAAAARPPQQRPGRPRKKTGGDAFNQDW